MKHFLIPQSLAGTGIQLLCGILLILVGFFTYPTATDKPDVDNQTPMTRPRKGNGIAPPTVGEADSTVASFRLQFRREKGVWMITPKGGRTEQLTDIIPGPRSGEDRTRFIPPGEVRRYLLSVLADWQLDLKNNEIQTLRALKLNNAPIFRATDFQAGKAVRPASDLSSPDQPRTAEVAGGRAPAPAEWDPFTQGFTAKMRTWQSQIKPLIQVVANEPGTVSVNLSSVRVSINKNARRRLLSDDYGIKPGDVAIYLQYLATLAGEPVIVDGQLGEGSREAMTTALKEMPDASGFVALLVDATGSGMPQQLQPGTALFNQGMKRWAARIQPTLSGATGETRIRFKPDYTAGKIELMLGSLATQRLAAANFGSQKRDEQIYLQYLANRFGETVAVDGRIGPGSRAALKRVLATTFRKPALTPTYENLLTRRF